MIPNDATTNEDGAVVAAVIIESGNLLTKHSLAAVARALRIPAATLAGLRDGTLIAAARREGAEAMREKVAAEHDAAAVRQDKGEPGLTTLSGGFLGSYERLWRRRHPRPAAAGGQAMTADPHGWPDASKPGVPLNPERDGWHWLESPQGVGLRAERWLASRRHWPSRGSRKAFLRYGWRYLGPCHTPAEVAALIEAAGRGAVEMCVQRVERYARAHYGAGALGSVVEALQALTPPTPNLDAIEAAAVERAAKGGGDE